MFANLSDQWKLTLQVLLVLGILGAAAAILLSMGVMNTDPESHQVSFRVEASGGYATITFEAGDEAITTPKTVTVPWSRKVRVKSGTEVYLTASNPTVTGELSCVITLDNVLWKVEKTSAPQNGVACAGIVP